jgi:hypothetical protein
MYGFDPRGAILGILLVGVLIGACGVCTVRYIDERVDVEVKVK